MPRLSRAKKREQKRAAAAAPVAAPIDVHVPVAGPGAGGASIGGVPVTAAPGEEIQQVVLTHLQRIALAGGHAVHATVHDERIGYVVPLLVEQDGSSHFTAEPVRTAPAGETVPSTEQPAPAAPAPAAGDPAPDATPYRDSPTQILRPLTDPNLDLDPDPAQEASPTFRLRPLPEPVRDAAPGTVAPPLGEFGPPPRMDAGPEPSDAPPNAAPPNAVPPNAVPPHAVPQKAVGQDAVGQDAVRQDAVPEADLPQDAVPLDDVPRAGLPDPAVPEADQPSDAPREPTAYTPTDPIPLSAPAPIPVRAADAVPGSRPDPVPAPDPVVDPDPKPTPPRGFDAVAEAVLGDPPPATTDASPFAEASARINDAVRAGRTQEAALLAERTVAEASAVLGPEHPEVLRIRELSAYIAYLAGDPERAFALSLDVARRHHRAHDAEAAYGSLHGAATAWRAVRDPSLGLYLGRDLLGLWDQLAAEGGPAADDVEELESARARMDRLSARAAKPAEPPRS
ncbi:tetratricopeptide repeat protein [Streptomyces ferrugineus]|uniref:Tetratricopeptide repeat protein n=1 Tax=Streptomyces ferrugineus TaxID=1413221 RepID=A0A7M2SLI3_9ACTN|nr:tetratricopeptide repeat protein [Streptomyces ferrugineus]QOV36328.1 tetratricopeptide repeat protein [Streptomyces ferrugineus]